MRRPALSMNRLALLMVAILLAPVFFWNLDTFPLRIWDESRLAINALEMARDGEWLITHFDGRPDLWNTKPPLLIWVQALAIKVVGAGDFAVRLPSALAAWLTCLLLVAFARTHLDKIWLGVLAAMVLASSPGFAGLHAARTADYDAPLTLLTTTYCLAFYLYLGTGRRRDLYGFWAALTLAILTKGVGGVLFLPALAIFTVVRRRTLFILRNRDTYIGLLLLIALIGGYYGLRESVGPGYLAEVIDNELGGRYLRSIEGHGESPDFFLHGFISGRFGPWFLFAPLGFAAGFYRRNTPLARLLRYTTGLSIFYFLVITFSQTKCRWYDVPLYPFLALIVAGGLYSVAQFLSGLPALSRHARIRALVPVGLVLLCLLPYRGALERARHTEDNGGFYRLGHVLKSALAGQTEVGGSRLLLQDYSPQNDFYLRLLRDQGCDIERRALADLRPGDYVLAQDGEMEEKLNSTFSCEPQPPLGRITPFRISVPSE